MRTEHRTIVVLDEDDEERLKSGEPIQLNVQNGSSLEIRMSETLLNLWDTEADPTQIPSEDEIGDLHYHNELIPLASSFGVIQEVGTRERDAVQKRLLEIRAQARNEDDHIEPPAEEDSPYDF